MSLWVTSSSLLSISPQVWFEHGAFHVKTSRLLQVLGLGSYARAVAIDPGMKRIEIVTRYLWGARSQRIIPFSDIAYLLYEFKSIGTSWSITPRTFDRADQLESYRIGVGLYSKEEVRLAAFRGEGSVRTGLIGVIGGDSIIDHEGTQGDESRSVIDILQNMIGCPLGRPLLDRGSIRVCGSCGRAGEPTTPRCACGGAWKVVR